MKAKTLSRMRSIFAHLVLIILSFMCLFFFYILLINATRSHADLQKGFSALPGSYLFSTIGKKVNAYVAANPDKKIIRLGIGDVTQPLAPAIISALHSAVDEMAQADTFKGYAPDLGYEFLRNAIAENDYKARGCDISADEIFVSDGAKCD